MALLTVQKATADAPIVLTYSAASSGGDQFPNTGRERLFLRNNALPSSTLAAPSVAPALAAAAGTTNLAAGTYTVAYAWGNATGETPIGPSATVAITAGQQINVSAIPVLPQGATFAAVYVSAAGGTALSRSGQTATTTYSITATATGSKPAQAQITVTITAQRKCSQGFLHNAADQVAAGVETILGPFDPNRFNDTANNVNVAYDTVNSVTVAAAA